jgi:hypothetical protein
MSATYIPNKRFWRGAVFQFGERASKYTNGLENFRFSNTIDDSVRPPFSQDMGEHIPWARPVDAMNYQRMLHQQPESFGSMTQWVFDTLTPFALASGEIVTVGGAVGVLPRAVAAVRYGNNYLNMLERQTEPRWTSDLIRWEESTSREAFQYARDRALRQADMEANSLLDWSIFYP